MSSTRIARRVETILRLVALLSGLVLVLTGVATVINAILRSFFASGIPAMVEMSGPILAACIFLALPYATLSGTHVKVVLLTDRLPGQVNRFFKIVGALAVSAMCAAVGYWMYFLTLDAAEIGMTTLSSPILLAPFMAVGTLGAWLAALAGFMLAVREARTHPEDAASTPSEETTFE